MNSAGGTFDRNHDALVHVHADAAREAGLLVQTEVRGLLTAGLPPAARAAAAAELRTSGRSWSQLVPDLMVDQAVYDMKVIHYCPSRYGCTQVAAPARALAANTRASKVPGEYIKKAKDVDREYAHTPADQVGPVERALADLGGATGLVYGHFGEASKSVADLQTYIAESMAAAHWQELGYVTRDHAKGCIRTDIRLKCLLVHMREKAYGGGRRNFIKC